MPSGAPGEGRGEGAAEDAGEIAVDPADDGAGGDDGAGLEADPVRIAAGVADAAAGSTAARSPQAQTWVERAITARRWRARTAAHGPAERGGGPSEVPGKA